MKKILLTLIVLLTASYLLSQNGWIDKSPNTTSSINDIFFVSASTGFVVCNSGKIYKTTNGGDNWTIQTSGVTNNLNSVFFVSSQKGYVVGDAGKILITSNGGTNWIVTTLSTPINLRDVFFNNPDSGVVVGNYSSGGYFVVTLNGGSSWLQQGPVPSTELRAVQQTDDTSAVSIGQMGTTAVISKITLNTSYSVKGNMSGGQFNNLHFPSSIGYVCGNNGVIYKTINSGNLWSYQTSSGLSTNSLYSVFFVNNTVGYVGSSGKIFRTLNGGSSWVQQYNLGTTNFKNIQFINDQIGFACGGTIVLKTISGGVNLTVNVSDTSLFCSDSVQIFASTFYNGTGTLTYSWSSGNSLSDSTIFNPYANPQNTTNYFVTVTDGVISASDSVVVTVVAFPTDSICMVSVDDSLGENIVIFEKNVSGAIDFYKIYRESNVSGVYDSIGFVPADSAGFFVDTASNPAVKAESYKISIVDSCSNESVLSNPHTTMHLTVNVGMSGSWNLNWTPYHGFQVVTYYIWRGDSTHNLTLIDSLPGTSISFSDFSPPSGGLYYQVEIIAPNVCHPYAKANTNYNSSLSNLADNGLIQPPNITAEFIGNPTSGNFPLTVQFTDQTTGTPDNWLWDFGDGDTSIVQNPSHIYSAAGIYTVKLTASNSSASDMITKVNYITVTVGLKENKLRNSIKIFPNPFTDETFILIENPNVKIKIVEVFDISGKKLKTIENPITNKIIIHRNGMKSGLYFIKLTTKDDYIYRDKIVLK